MSSGDSSIVVHNSQCPKLRVARRFWAPENKDLISWIG
jgi:hypothetical protein